MTNGLPLQESFEFFYHEGGFIVSVQDTGGPFLAMVSLSL